VFAPVIVSNAEFVVAAFCVTAISSTAVAK
jgi:hypothetical protein